MHLNLFSIYFTNCNIFNIINQVFNFNVLKFTYSIFMNKFVAVNNSWRFFKLIFINSIRTFYFFWFSFNYVFFLNCFFSFVISTFSFLVSSFSFSFSFLDFSFSSFNCYFSTSCCIKLFSDIKTNSFSSQMSF